MTETRAEHNMERLQRLAHSPKEGGNLTDRDLLLAENADLRRQPVELLAVVKDLAEALIETTNTLEVVDPNAPSLELANEVIDKHIRVIGPLIEEAQRGREATDG